MPDFPIKLGQNYSKELNPTPMSSPEEYHPTTCLEWSNDYELPDTGLITFRYRVNRSVEEKTPGREKYREELDLLELVDVVPAKPDKKDEDYGGPALDKLRDEATKKSKE